MDVEWSNRGATTIPRVVNEAAEKWPDKTFLDFSGETFTYAQVRREATRIAHGLTALGVSPGDRVCAMLDNNADAVFVWFGAILIGAVYVPLNTEMKGTFLRHQLADSGSAVVIAEASYAPRIFAIADGIPEVHTVVSRGPVTAETRLAIRNLDSIRSDDTTPVESSSNPGDLAMLLYTSGTTGPSKGCMLSHNYVCNVGAQCAKATLLTSNDILWTPCPLFHLAGAFGVLMNALCVGATASIYPRFSASNFWPEIARSRATAVQLLSVMLSIVPNEPDTEASTRCYGQLRTVFGAPLNAGLIAKWKERFGVKHVSSPLYGMTEASMMTSVTIETAVPDGASGRRNEEFDVRIVDPEGNECPANVAGEIIVRPRRPNIMFHGYWQCPEATAAATRDLWFHTGDMGRFDENGFFFFVDRKKDYLRRGGENISSFEVEAAFLSHPEIAEVAAHAVASDLSEDELKITAVLKPGASVTEEALCRWSLDQVPHFAIPRFIEFRSHLPRTPTGRIQKFMLRDAGVTASTWDRKASDIVVPRR